jgi:hypothetical protein
VIVIINIQKVVEPFEIFLGAEMVVLFCCVETNLWGRGLLLAYAEQNNFGIVDTQTIQGLKKISNSHHPTKKRESRLASS